MLLAGVFLTNLFENPANYVSVVLVVMLSVVLHELGHALAATWEGDPTPRLRGHFTWNPVVHMGWLAIGLLLVVGWTFGKTPVTPAYFRHRRWGEAIVAFAGPAVNLCLAVFSAVVFVLLAKAGALHEGSDAAGQWVAEFWMRAVWINVLLFLLNMIPLPPLDGFTVLEGSVNLGDLGAKLRSLGMFPLIVAILIVNSGPFDDLVGTLAMGVLSGAQVILSPF
jgi:Zn-dependent protease